MEDCKLLDHSIKNLNKEFAGHKCFAECHVCVSAALLLNEFVLRVSQIQLSTIGYGPTSCASNGHSVVN